MGAFPLVVYWDADSGKDLLVGQADGKLRLFLNVGTDSDPTFDGGTFLQVGEPGFKADVDVGSRATPNVVDWNNDGKRDVIAGALDGKVRVFLNQGTDTAPDFRTQGLVQADGLDLVVPSGRSSPVIRDLDDDGKKDILTGNTAGQLLLYRNTGSDDTPSFSNPVFVEAEGVLIDLAGLPRSRPSLCDWTSDGLSDVLIGAGDGKVHLYHGSALPGDFNGDGVIDEDDADEFELCYTGPDAGPIDPGCETADFDGDGDIDCDDWDAFIEAWATSNESPPPSPAQPCATGIPAADVWGIATMTLLVLTAGTVLLRQRRGVASN